MEKYKLKDFTKWAKKERLTDIELNKALKEMEQGLLGDRLGANIFKKRISISGRGKRGGARTIILFKKGELALFLYGYSKNEKSNLSEQEESQLRIFSKSFFSLKQT